MAVPLLLTPASPARQTATTTITVTLTDKSIKLSKKSVPAGKLIFRVKNTGKRPHDFKIANKKTPVLKKGKSARLVITFKKAKKYAYLSTRPGDAKRGLKGVLRVTAAPSSGGTSNLAAGKTVFQTTGCGGCHVLKAGGGVGTVGPNLDTAPLTLALVVNRVTNGKGAMPAYKGQLSTKQIQDVSNFIVKSKTG